MTFLSAASSLLTHPRAKNEAVRERERSHPSPTLALPPPSRKMHILGLWDVLQHSECPHLWAHE